METVVKEAAWLEYVGIIMQLVVWPILVWLAGKLVTKITSKIDDETARTVAFEALMGGVKAMEPIVASIKAAASDGKLTRDEIKEIEAQAFAIAKTQATGPAKDVLVKWGKDIVSGYISQLINKIRGEGKSDAGSNSSVPSETSNGGTDDAS